MGRKGPPHGRTGRTMAALFKWARIGWIGDRLTDLNVGESGNANDFSSNFECEVVNQI